ncbi:MAG: DUF547 domain-containing protein [Candidatus Binatia bacterium]
MRVLLALAAVAGLAVTGEASGPRNDLWGEILRARVTPAGEVAYRTIARVDRDRLAEYLASLAAADLGRMSADETVAFWINAHNAMVVFGVIHGGNPETLAGRARLYHWFQLELAGARRTLDGIAILLETHAAADPRIHFALCIGTRGSPPLAVEPYDADRLDSALAAAGRRFVNDSTRNRLDLVGRRVELSPVFAWHEADFTRSAGSLPAFVGRLAVHPKAALILRRPEVSASFREFDWRLNAAPGEHPFE